MWIQVALKLLGFVFLFIIFLNGMISIGYSENRWTRPWALRKHSRCDR
jgi:hypothetical protein